MSGRHDEHCHCYDCVMQWAAEHDPSTGRRRSSSGRSRSSGPPIAKNPANQEYINKRWKEEQERKAKARQQRRGGRGGEASKTFGTGNTDRYGDNRYTDPVHGTTDDGREVTASFGREGTSREGHSLLRDGHAETPDDFYGSNGAEQHDHFDGRGGTQRGKHSD